MLWMTLLWWVGQGWAQAEPCVCPEEDAAAVFARSSAVYIARSGDNIPSELTPLISLKGELPERAYITETWEACDLESGPQGSMMLIIVDDIGHLSRCGGAGPLPTPGDGGMTATELQAWLRYGGWLSEPPAEDTLVRLVERELLANPLQYGEQGVAIDGFPDIDRRLTSGAPIRSLSARVPGPRWMSLTVMASEGGLYYIGWHHEQGDSGGRSVWESHSLWRLGGSDPIALWRAESPHTPVLDAAPGERVGIETLAGAPQIAAFDDGSAVAMLPGQELFALQLDPERGWKPPQPLSDGAASGEAVLASGDVAAVAAWVEDGVLRARRYTPSMGWSDTARLAEPPAADPSLAVNDRGEALLMWKGLEGQRYVRRMDAGGAWGPPVGVASAAATQTDVSLSDSGRGLMVWVEGGAVRGRRTDRKGSWGKQRALSYDKAAAQPSGAIDRWGRTVVAWVEGEGTSRELFARTYLPLRGWTAEPERLMTNRRGAAGPPSVVMSDTGGATVFWLQEGTRGMLWARHFTLRRGWASPEQVLLPGPADLTAPPAAALHDSGVVSLAWSGDGSGWTARYAAGAGFGRLAAFEELDPPVHGLSVDGYADDGAMFIWSQGAISPWEVWVREQPLP